MRLGVVWAFEPTKLTSQGHTQTVPQAGDQVLKKMSPWVHLIQTATALDRIAFSRSGGLCHTERQGLKEKKSLIS